MKIHTQLTILILLCSNFLFSQNKDVEKSNKRYVLSNFEKINTIYSDFGATFYEGKTVFSSVEKKSKYVKRILKKNKKPFFRLYKLENNQDVSLFFLKQIKKRYHESTVALSPDKKVLYFTRNNFKKGTIRIYSARLINNKWGDIKEIPFKSNDHSMAHPSVSKDGKRLYFASDMPGGFGGLDLYYVKIKGKNNYGSPVNLGAEINTDKRESFPFIADDNTLYFSSDRPGGMGMLDVYSSKLIASKFEAVKHLMTPINSEFDDFAFVLNSVTKKGYVSSNRKGGKGDDDIYLVTQLKDKGEDPCFRQKTGVIRDKLTNKLLPNTKVIVYDTSINSKIDSLVVGADAKFNFKLNCNTTYRIAVIQKGYTLDSNVFKVSSDTNSEFVLNLTPNEFILERKQLMINIKSIYYDFDKYTIPKEAFVELDKVVNAMLKYPKIIIELKSHTDSRGKKSYNLKLSERRAQKIMNYLVSKGINKERIIAKGYGESELLIDCLGTEECSKKEFQLNRRTEFIIKNIKMIK